MAAKLQSWKSTPTVAGMRRQMEHFSRAASMKGIVLTAARAVMSSATRVIEALPLPGLIGLFFAPIRAPLSNGSITSAALSALHSFFVCNLMAATSLSLEPALVELSSMVSHCKFEASDSSGDKVVFLKIMNMIHDCIAASSVGAFLGYIEIYKMLETVLMTACQMRLSGAL
ncbi:hypothetical protein EV702DRAFT_1198097 [Suillus placidus]|uniref:Uncharacterized protein n=1 Tax=Suillus placidus TaxID=48579 RepID=A0A9P6ZUF9_9AGAM|nr:hypothetical protein EV702DRAFT_1198097 [Suillus placidus]